MKTLNELSQLRDSEFGRPHPRHGLKLLYWFAKDCVSFENGNIMLSKCDPANGDFGFHPFKNRPYESVKTLILNKDFPSYVVGNLNVRKYPKAKKLPDYVSEDRSPDQHNSNTDRIIVSLSKDRQLHRVYVTHHLNLLNYDPDATYQISRGLLMIIMNMSLEDFLEKMGYKPYKQPHSPQTTSTDSQDYTASSKDSDDIESDTENSETKPLINDNTSTEKPPKKDNIPLKKVEKPTKETPKKVPKKKESSNRCCTIL